MTGSDAATYFGGRTSVYDSAYDRVDADGHALRARLAVVLRMLGSGGGEALDAGMGPGRLCAELDARGWTVSGIDASEQMVEVARDRLPMARERLLRAEIEALPFAPESFDAVAATGVLEYADVTRAVSELAPRTSTGRDCGPQLSESDRDLRRLEDGGLVSRDALRKARTAATASGPAARRRQDSAGAF